MRIMNRIKNFSTAYGGYRALRWAQDHISDRARLREFRERLEFYRSLIHRDDLCFDVGSNIGDISAVLLGLGARVVAVDPQPAAMRELRARLAGNARLTCVQAGVAESPGELELYLHDQVGTTSMVKEWSAGRVINSITVPVVTLDDLIARFGVPRYCKIDVEGFELNVLRGLGRQLDLLSFELHTDQKSMAAASRCLNLLEQHGDIEMNVISYKRYSFAWSKWVGRNDFEKRFAADFGDDPAFAYGDIFVRCPTRRDRHG
jgi:FkbM family methyltransferase